MNSAPRSRVSLRLQRIEGAVAKRGDAEVVARQVSSRKGLADALIVGRQGGRIARTQDARTCEVEGAVSS